MPNLTISLTTAQATRAATMLRATYLNDPRLTDVEIGQQFILGALKKAVLDYEKAKAISDATKTISIAEF